MIRAIRIDHGLVQLYGRQIRQLGVIDTHLVNASEALTQVEDPSGRDPRLDQADQLVREAIGIVVGVQNELMAELERLEPWEPNMEAVS